MKKRTWKYGKTADIGKTVTAVTDRNAMEISIKGLTLAVTVIMALMLSAISLYIVNKARGSINEGSAQFSRILGDYSELTSTIYDGMYVAGSKVIDCIDEVTGEDIISVTVVTGMNEAGGNAGETRANTYAGAGHQTDTSFDTGIMQLRTSAAGASPYEMLGLSPDNINYINPAATFIGSVNKNANGMVVNITFTQK